MFKIGIFWFLFIGFCVAHAPESFAAETLGRCANGAGTTITNLGSVPASTCRGYALSTYPNRGQPPPPNPPGTYYSCGYNNNTLNPASFTTTGEIYWLSNNYYGGSSNQCQSRLQVRWIGGACPAGFIRNPETLECVEEEEDPTCNVTEALSFYGGGSEYNIENFAENKPTIVQTGSMWESFCSSLCEVKVTTTAIVTSDTDTQVFIKESTQASVTAENCEALDPPGQLLVEEHYNIPDPDCETNPNLDFCDDDIPTYCDLYPTAPGCPDEPDDDYCTLHPNSPACEDDDDDSTDPPPTTDPPVPPCVGDCTSGGNAVCGGPGLPPCNVKLYGNTGTSSATCSQAPSYGGDKLMGAQLIQIWRVMCGTDKTTKAVEKVGTQIVKGFTETTDYLETINEGIKGIGETLNTGTDGTITVERGGVESWQAELDASKESFAATIDSVMADAQELFASDAIQGVAGGLPCESAMDGKFELCFDDQETALLPIGAILVFLSFVAGFFMLIRK